MRILYGLPSEGMGHATRSKVIIENLLKNHDVQIVTSDCAFVFLSTHFPNRVHPINGFHLALHNEKISVLKTAFHTIQEAPENLKHNFQQYKKLLDNFTFDVVISDFESFTLFYATFNKLPLVSIDNMQIIDKANLDIEIPFLIKPDYILAKQIIHAKVYGADYYLITSFFYPNLKQINASYIPPIIRDEIINVETKYGNHILVYQKSMALLDLIEILKQFPKQIFIICGSEKEMMDENVICKKFSETIFIQDFGNAKAVICNGGFSFISEAVYLKKPIYTVPIENQFEQYVNAAYIEKLGYGKMSNRFTYEDLQSFSLNLLVYQDHLSKYQQDGNRLAFSKLDNILMSFK